MIQSPSVGPANLGRADRVLRAVPQRLPLFILVCLLALGAAAGAGAYPWPVKPFNKQHPIRANFGDPNAAIGNSVAGQISGTQPARIMQVALKAVF